MCVQDIDNILKRSTTVVHNGSASAAEPLGSGFSKAHFVSDEAGEIDIDDPEFWTKAVGLKAPEPEEVAAQHSLGPRARRTVGGRACFRYC